MRIECTFPNPKAKKPNRKKTTKTAKKALVDLSGEEDKLDDMEVEDLRALDGWDDEEDEDAMAAAEAGDFEGHEDDEDDDAGGIWEKEDGWKVLRGKSAAASKKKSRRAS